MAAKLETVAHDNIVSNLGKIAENIDSNFCCGGMLDSPRTVKLYLKKTGDSETAAPVLFPGASESDVQQLLDAASVATFGVGSEPMADRSYHDAYKLYPAQFFTTFELCNTTIPDQITTLMVPGIRQLRCKLYKLNIYGAPGGHFKAHVDTPRSEQMFGSLVVCLPTCFSGGVLVTRHHQQEVKFDWASSSESPMQKLCWAAFFCDVEHEVLPVTAGYCITLTYNLCGHKSPVSTLHPSLDITTSPLYRELRSALSNPIFMRDGGVLGFSCQYVYAFHQLKTDTPLLKGVDPVVYLVAKSLGLSVMVKPIWCNKYVLSFKPECDLVRDLTNQPTYSHKKITWCQELTHWEPAGAVSRYSEPAFLAVYQSAAILVGIPKWGRKRRGYVTGQSEEESQQENSSEDDVDINKFCFSPVDWSSNHKHKRPLGSPYWPDWISSTSLAGNGAKAEDGGAHGIVDLEPKRARRSD